MVTSAADGDGRRPDARAPGGDDGRTAAAARRILEALADIPDPEIPTVSIVELGMIHEVRVDGGAARVRFLPTFAGCPALEYIRDAIRRRLTDLGFAEAHVEAVHDPPWTSDRITHEGRRKLRAFGLSPPTKLNAAFVSLDALRRVECPHCGSRETQLETPFGPTLCRAIHYCRACRQSFEQFKPV